MSSRRSKRAQWTEWAWSDEFNQQFRQCIDGHGQVVEEEYLDPDTGEQSSTPRVTGNYDDLADRLEALDVNNTTDTTTFYDDQAYTLTQNNPADPRHHGHSGGASSSVARSSSKQKSANRPASTSATKTRSERKSHKDRGGKLKGTTAGMDPFYDIPEAEEGSAPAWDLADQLPSTDMHDETLPSAIEEQDVTFGPDDYAVPFSPDEMSAEVHTPVLGRTGKGKGKSKGHVRVKHAATSKEMISGKTQPEMEFEEGYDEDPDMLAAVQESRRQNQKPRHGESSRQAAEQVYNSAPAHTDLLDTTNSPFASVGLDTEDVDPYSTQLEEIQEEQGLIGLNPPINPSFGDDFADGSLESQLDPRFCVEPSWQFVPGSVFKSLSAEPYGATKRPRDKMSDSTFFDTPMGSFYVNFRRYIVIATDAGHSTCVPILTYTHQGCRKHGVKPHHHGIIHTTGTTPMMCKGEPELGFLPVQFVANDHREKLAMESRVNYAKLITVEHNTKVFFIGNILDEDFIDVVQPAVDACWASMNHSSSQGGGGGARRTRHHRDNREPRNHGRPGR